jgi:hypothetical protein
MERRWNADGIGTRMRRIFHAACGSHVT